MPDYMAPPKVQTQQNADHAKKMFSQVDMSMMPSHMQQGFRGALAGEYIDPRVAKAYGMAGKLLSQGPLYSQVDIENNLMGIRKNNRQMLDQNSRFQQDTANAGGMLDSGVSEYQAGQVRGQADADLGQQVNQANQFFDRGNYMNDYNNRMTANDMLTDLRRRKVRNQANLAVTQAQAAMAAQGSSPWAGALSGAASGAGAGAAFGPWGALIGGVAGAGMGYMGSK